MASGRFCRSVQVARSRFSTPLGKVALAAHGRRVKLRGLEKLVDAPQHVGFALGAGGSGVFHLIHQGGFQVGLGQHFAENDLAAGVGNGEFAGAFQDGRAPKYQLK